jgi:glycosyltransferase involved in cell wall biosynthesis
LLFVSRVLVEGGVSGPYEYAKAVIECLTSHRFSIEYLWLGPLPKHKIWHRIPENVVMVERLWMPFAWRAMNYVAPRDPKRWLWISLWRLGNFIRRLKIVRNWRFIRRFRSWVDMKLESWNARFSDGALPDLESQTKFECVCERVKPEIVMVNYFVLAPLFDKISNPEISKVVLTLDASHSAVDWQTELACLQRADVLLAIHEDDANELKQSLPEKEVLPFPMPLETVDCVTAPKEGRVLFVGAGHYANVHGLKWFLDKIWPQVQKRRPDAEFHVCGSVCEHFEDMISRVSFRGRLEDLTQEYAEASVVVVPLLDGTGLKIKLVDALRHGRPVVATSCALQGIGFAENVCALRADSPETFATAVIRLLGNHAESQQMQLQAIELVQERFSRESCARPFLRWLPPTDNK